jgi:hypothetical protein
MAEKTQTFEEWAQTQDFNFDVSGVDMRRAFKAGQGSRDGEVAALEERIRQLEARISLALLKAEDMHDSDDWLDAGELIDLLRAAAGKKGT